MKQNTELVTLTEELIRAGMKSGAGLKRQQAKVLGERMPLKSGWMERSIGKQITEDQYKWFLKCIADEYLKPKKKKRGRKPQSMFSRINESIAELKKIQAECDKTSAEFRDAGMARSEEYEKGKVRGIEIAIHYITRLLNAQ